MSWDIWLIFFVLGVVVPWRGRVRLRELLTKAHVGTGERLALYASTIAFQWVVAGIVAWRASAHGYSSATLGLLMGDQPRVAMAAFVGAAVLALLHWLNLRRIGRMKASARGILQPLAERILPQSSVETMAFIALAVTAGLCEEFIYRGFAFAAFRRAGLPMWSVVLVASILFGLAHLYQGRGGFFGTMILGALFGAARIAYDSLLPVMAWHAAVDIVAGLAGSRYLTDNKHLTV